MYTISGKQLISIALCSAVVAGVIVACAQRGFDRAVPIEPIAIADPSVATDEQNNVEIYHAVSPGVVNITNRGYQENYWGVFPSEGAGSGSIIEGSHPYQLSCGPGRQSARGASRERQVSRHAGRD